jgi:hypothetical protein
MTFWTALYFAVSSISTAGLQGLKTFAKKDEVALGQDILVC